MTAVPIALVTILLTLAAASQAQQRNTWSRIYPSEWNDEATDVVQSFPDGGFVVTGTTRSYGLGTPEEPNAFLMRIDRTGEIEWLEAYGDERREVVFDLIQTFRDPGFAFVGSRSLSPTNDDGLFIKTDPDGSHQWTRTYGGSNGEGLLSLVDLRGEGYLLAGHATRGSFPAQADAWIIRADANGDTLWTRRYGGEGAQVFHHVEGTRDGGFIALGRTSATPDGSFDLYVVKADRVGEVQWERSYGGTGLESAGAVRQLLEGGYIIGGSTTSPPAISSDYYLIRIDSRGDPIWERVYTEPGGQDCRDLIVSRDGGFLLIGVHTPAGGQGDLYLRKTDAEGNPEWTRSHGTYSYNERGQSGRQTRDGGFILAGMKAGGGPGENAHVLKTDEHGEIHETAPVCSREIVSLTSNAILVSPNPFTGSTTVAEAQGRWFTLFDVSGRRVGRYDGSRIAWNLPGGVYFLWDEVREHRSIRLLKLH